MRKYKGCIYVIKTRSLSNELYVGSTCNLHARSYTHLKSLREKTHRNCNLQNHVNTYGVDDIYFEEIESVPEREMLKNREQYYIDALNPSMNIHRFSSSALGFKHSEETKKKIAINSAKRTGYVHSEETKLLMSKSWEGRVVSEQARRNMSAAKIGSERSQSAIDKAALSNTGKKRSDEFKLRMSEVHKGKKISDHHRKRISEWGTGRMNSPETILKMRQSALKRSRKVIDISSGHVYDCAKDAAIAFGISLQSLGQKLNGKTLNKTTLSYL